MKRLLTLAALLFLPLADSAHDVPEEVRIKVWLKPEPGRMTMLVRMPANALIDILFPALPGTALLDLERAGPFADEGARVWIAALLSLAEDGRPLPEPRVVATRISRTGDPSFDSFAQAMAHVRDRQDVRMLLLQEEATVDALLETPIGSAASDFTFEPRFGRVGVRVTTNLTFVAPSGNARQFEYGEDAEPFLLNPTTQSTLTRFFGSGLRHVLHQRDYWLFLLCVVLAVRRFRHLAVFAAVFFLSQLVSAAGILPVSPRLIATLTAALIAYAAIEVILTNRTPAEDATVLPGTGIAAGFIFGAGLFLVSGPALQFGGAHRTPAIIAFGLGAEAGQSAILLLVFALLPLALRAFKTPRTAIIIAGAIALRISWHEMLDRAQFLSAVKDYF